MLKRSQFGKQENRPDGYRGLSSTTQFPEFRSNVTHINVKNLGVCNSNLTKPELIDLKTSIISVDPTIQTHSIYKSHRSCKRKLRCRGRFKKRRKIRKTVESSILSGPDSSPFAKVTVGDCYLTGLLDSGANISVLGKNSLAFLKALDLNYKTFKSSLSTADGSRNDIIGYCSIPIKFKGLLKISNFI